MYTIADLLGQMALIFASPFMTMVVQWVKAMLKPPKASYKWLALATALISATFLAVSQWVPAKTSTWQAWCIYAGTYLVAGLLSWQACGKFWDEYGNQVQQGKPPAKPLLK